MICCISIPTLTSFNISIPELPKMEYAFIITQTHRALTFVHTVLCLDVFIKNIITYVLILSIKRYQCQGYQRLVRQKLRFYLSNPIPVISFSVKKIAHMPVITYVLFYLFKQRNHLRYFHNLCLNHLFYLPQQFHQIHIKMLVGQYLLKRSFSSLLLLLFVFLLLLFSSFQL